MNQRIKILFLVVMLGLGSAYYFRADIDEWRRSAGSEIGQGIDLLKIAEPQINTAPPLRGPVREVPSTLTVSGTIKETNMARQENGFMALSVNAKLTRAAEAKVDDMFNRQYFEHESPTGVGPGDLADNVGYEYLMIGENLALGNYEDDKALVEAWMNSPGHRANILRPHYTEIGVAVKRGLYEGRTVWLAVQEFGRPQSDCPSPSESLNVEIEADKNRLDELSKQLSPAEEEIRNSRPKRGPAYRQKVDAYNELVRLYNTLADETEILITRYNDQISAYNACLQ